MPGFRPNGASSTHPAGLPSCPARRRCPRTTPEVTSRRCGSGTWTGSASWRFCGARLKWSRWGGGRAGAQPSWLRRCSATRGRSFREGRRGTVVRGVRPSEDGGPALADHRRGRRGELRRPRPRAARCSRRRGSTRRPVARGYTGPGTLFAVSDDETRNSGHLVADRYQVQQPSAVAPGSGARQPEYRAAHSAAVSGASERTHRESEVIWTLITPIPGVSHYHPTIWKGLTARLRGLLSPPPPAQTAAPLENAGFQAQRRIVHPSCRPPELPCTSPLSPNHSRGDVPAVRVRYVDGIRELVRFCGARLKWSRWGGGRAGAQPSWLRRCSATRAAHSVRGGGVRWCAVFDRPKMVVLRWQTTDAVSAWPARPPCGPVWE